MVHLLDVYSIRENLFWVGFAFTFFFFAAAVSGFCYYMDKERGTHYHGADIYARSVADEGV